jgi:hypothetical protein
MEGKPGQHRLCWLIQNCMEKQSYRRRLGVRETKDTPLEKLTLKVLKIGRRELTNRVNTSLTLARRSADRVAVCAVSPSAPS